MTPQSKATSTSTPSRAPCVFCMYVCVYVFMYVCMYGHTYRKSMDQPGKVANPARGQLNRINDCSPVRVRA